MARYEAEMAVQELRVPDEKVVRVGCTSDLPRGTKPRPSGPRRCLVGWTKPHAKSRQREHRRCRVGLANKHGRPATWWPPDRPLSQNHCRQVKELPLGC
jgi:hypothetical protein